MRFFCGHLDFLIQYQSDGEGCARDFPERFPEGAVKRLMDISELVLYKSILVLGFLMLLFVSERKWPAAQRPGAIATPRRLGKNLSLWLCNSALSPLIVLPITLFAVNQSAADWRTVWPEDGWGIALDILLLDLWIYWWHRANHRLPLLWRFHRVHHLDQWLDVTSAVRFHFGEVVLSALVRGAVILLIGFPLLSVILFESLVLAMAGFHHSNIRLPANLEKWLSWVIVTPSIHWVHHYIDQRDTDSNYGAIFSFWDRLFASRSDKVREPAMPIGVDQAKDEGFWSLLLIPFRR